MPRTYTYKPRSDSWAGKLTEEEQCAIYERWMRTGAMWHEVADWAMREFADHMDAKPSQTSMFVWRRHFAETFNRHEAAKIREAGELLAEYAKQHNVSDPEMVKALKAIAAQAAAKGDFKTMLDCMKTVTDMETTALRTEAQKTKDAELALAREKFEAAEKRLAAVDETVKDVKLTPEQKVAELDKLFGRA